jgi:hypothetical protein
VTITTTTRRRWTGDSTWAGWTQLEKVVHDDDEGAMSQKGRAAQTSGCEQFFGGGGDAIDKAIRGEKNGEESPRETRS